MENTAQKKECFKILAIDEDKYKTMFNRKYEMRKKWQEPDPKIVNAILPGTITKIYVTEGQEVTINDKLLTFEAMKMKNLIFSPITGKVKKIHVNEGQMIAKKDLLIELET